MNEKLPGGTAHRMPADFRKRLELHPAAIQTWRDITSLARNEWICWIVSVKRQDTREQHVKRAVDELAAGDRRPCCWTGCIHRKDKPMNNSQRWLTKQK